MPTDNSINVIDLFAGCGGLTQGFHGFRPSGADRSPFRTVGAVEMDPAAASTYAANFAGEAGGTDRIHAKTIEDWDPGAVEETVDVILGGPPCQGFSALNKKNLDEDSEDDERNKLWREYAKVVKRLKPKIFIIENVDRFFRSKEFELLLKETSGGGLLRDYQLTEHEVLNSADFGVPQARRRAILLATHRDVVLSHPKQRPIDYPIPTHAKVSPKGDPFEGLGSLEPWTHASVVFNRTPRETQSVDLVDRYCSPLDIKLPGTFLTTELHVGRNPKKRSIKRYEAIPLGGNRWDLPDHLSTESWLRHRSGSGDVMGRMHLDRPSVTIRTEFYKPEKGRYLHPTAHRPITHYEAALLQGFPENFLWCGSKVQIARQIGNAVPVGLAGALAESVYHYLLEAEVIAKPVTATSA